MAGSVDPAARTVQPEGVALAIVVVSPIFLFFSILAVAARIYVRVTENVTSIDDYLLLGSLVSNSTFLQFCYILAVEIVMRHKRWLINIFISSTFNVNLSMSNITTDILYPRHSDRHPCRHRRSRHGQRPPQCVDANTGDEVVHDMDLDICHRTGTPQILHLYDDMENR